MKRTQKFRGTEEQLLNALECMSCRNNLTLTDKTVILAAIDMINEMQEKLIGLNDAKDALIKELVAAVTDEREMVCQDFDMQLRAALRVEYALQKAKDMGYET